jgi:tripartite-type tricarboxylate transporter receptor subunit TctC
MHGRNAVLSSANHKGQSQGPITRANDKGQDKEEPPMRRRDLLALSLAALPMALRPAAAQSKYPERPIRLVIPFPPGGVYDAVGRPWADRVKPTLGTVVVENIGGAGGALGAAAVARAPSDGYTLLLGGGGALVLTPIASSRPPFDPVRDFEPIALLVTTGLAIVVHPALPEKTLAELID